MLKQKEYNWKETNVSSIGSKEDRELKKESAKTEKAWIGSGSKVGKEIWRINKFEVEKWPIEEHGKFFDGDSYIILNTYKDPEKNTFLYDIHFWIGKYSTQDEYGTAAYKTVELDTYHDDKPIQHREVQGHESALFKSYFDSLTLLSGGCDSGFKKVEPENYKPRLLQIVGERKKIEVIEIPFKRGNLNSQDVFIIDMGLQIYQYNGEFANKDEKYKAAQFVQRLKSERKGKSNVKILEEKNIGLNHPIIMQLKEGKTKTNEPLTKNEKGMFRISDANGNMEFKQISHGTIRKDDLDSNDVFLVDSGNHLFVWIGSGASVDERKYTMFYAHNYLQDKHNPFCPVTCLGEQQAKQNTDFNKIFN